MVVHEAWQRVRWPLLIGLLVACVAGSCSLWSDYSDGNTCAKNEDCFRAQGETCNLSTKKCEKGQGVDAATAVRVTGVQP